MMDISCVQGASVIVYRSADIRKYQIFAYPEWPGGLFASPSMAGTRPGMDTLLSNVIIHFYTFVRILLAAKENE